MDYFTIFVILVFGIPVIGCLYLAIDIILHLKGIRVSSNEFVVKKCSTLAGRKRAKIDISLCLFVVFICCFILFDGLLH